MLHAVESEAREIYSLMNTRKDIFPHIRFDYVQRACREGRCVYEDGVVIIYQRYKRTVQLGTVRIPAGSVMLHQIISKYPKAASRVFPRFCDAVEADVYLSVRESNVWARAFYERMGMTAIGTVSWMQGALPGVIYWRANRAGLPFGEANVFSGGDGIPLDKTTDL
jgi:hypothetical protein